MTVRIGVTQRVEYIREYSEIRDALDHRWTVLLEKLGYLVVPIPNELKNPVLWLDQLGIMGLLMTGGNDISSVSDSKNVCEKRDKLENALFEWAGKNSIPLLGVCRGMQLMNLWLGGGLTSIKGHAGIWHELNYCTNGLDFLGYPTVVNSYHNWGISSDQLAEKLIPQCCSSDGYIEAAIHSELPWHGVMWHPERHEKDTDYVEKLFSRVFR